MTEMIYNERGTYKLVTCCGRRGGYCNGFAGDEGYDTYLCDCACHKKAATVSARAHRTT